MKEFEEQETVKRDQDILKICNDETNHEKTTRQLSIQNEIENLKIEYKKRLESFKHILNEKYQKEKQNLDDMITEKINQYKSQIQYLDIDMLNSREEILTQVRKGCHLSENPDSYQFEELNSRIKTQKEENQKLKETVSALQIEQRAVQSNLTKIIQDLTQKIKKTELEIDSYQNHTHNNKLKSARPKLVLNRREHSKSVINLDALKKDVQEIKALVTVFYIVIFNFTNEIFIESRYKSKKWERNSTRRSWFTSSLYDDWYYFFMSWNNK